jgi:protocadherin gamma subfamily A
MFQFLFFINFLFLVSSIPKESIHIIEDLPIGTSIYTFITDGCKTENSTGIYRFVDSQKNSNDFFLIDPYTGRVTTKKLIDRDDFCLRRMCSCSKCDITLEVLCVNTGQIYFNDLSIIIDDRNDHAPQFPKSSIIIDVLENVPIGYLIPIDVAIDPDYGINSIQGYKLFEDNSSTKNVTNKISNAFQIEYSKKNDLLALRLMKILDRESFESLQYVIQAYDGGQPQALIGRLNIRINVLDVNDMSPVFDRTDIRVILSESTTVGSLVARVHAFDGDTGLNGLVYYTIVSLDPPSNGTFILSKETGEIRLGKKLDYEKEKFYRIKIKAQDNGPQQGSIAAFATVDVDVKDENDNYPLITPSFNDDAISGVQHLLNSSIIRIRENTPNGTFLVSDLVFEAKKE